MAKTQNSLQHFGLQDWWDLLGTSEQKFLGDAYGQQKGAGKRLLSSPHDRHLDIAFLSDLLIATNKKRELQAKIVDKLMERYARLAAPDDLLDDAIVELHHTQIRVMNYFYGQRNYSPQAFDMVLRIAQDNINIEARVLRIKRERVKRAEYRKAALIEKEAQNAQRKGDLLEAANLHIEARTIRIGGMYESCAYSEEHPCFRQMAIIAEKNNDFDLALRIALDARRAGWIDRNEDWTRRINRLHKKISERDNLRYVEDTGPVGGYLGAFNLSGFFKHEFAPAERKLIIDELTNNGAVKHPLIDGTLAPDGHTARTALTRLAATAAKVLTNEHSNLTAHLDAIADHLERYPQDEGDDVWERHLIFGQQSLECFAVVQGRADSKRSWAKTLDPLLMMNWYGTSAIEFEEVARREFADKHEGDNEIKPTHPARSAILMLAEAFELDEDIEPVARESKEDGWAGPWEAVLARHRH